MALTPKDVVEQQTGSFLKEVEALEKDIDLCLVRFLDSQGHVTYLTDNYRLGVVKEVVDRYRKGGWLVDLSKRPGGLGFILDFDCAS